MLVNGAVPVAPARVGEVPPDTPLEEGLAPFTGKLPMCAAVVPHTTPRAAGRLPLPSSGGGRLRWGCDVRRVRCGRRVTPGGHGQGHRWAGGCGGGTRATLEPALGWSVPRIGQQWVERPQLQGSRNRWGRSRGRGPLRDQQLLAFRVAGQEARP
ncbi:hypothetical protein TNIN_115541 [Trichonephila inaurata madagascariensis]|uniref:Uncharacterized protein n=1 Tax=Trichonephila inaurata madagascariensis TaxID=2747483 RepID=A0A8X6XEB9_9ARAC|nr:hypothetical protein TNIN_115541 [Trichonephila inaurata madagascariensis]